MVSALDGVLVIADCFALSVVDHAGGYQSQAQSIASKLGITQVRQATSDDRITMTSWLPIWTSEVA